MRTDAFDYELPEHLIAQERIHPYDHAKLLALNREKRTFHDDIFYNIINYLSPSDVLVFNKTKVFKARLFATKESGGNIEVLLQEPIEEGKFTYLCLIQGKVKAGDIIIFAPDLKATVEKLLPNGDRIIAFNESEELKRKVDDIAHMPLPHYISNKKGEREYQTVYADNNEEKSIAAPTAGFHFTEELLKKIKEKGIQLEYVSLNVGIGTFRPVKTADVESHEMHYEQYAIDSGTLERLNRYKEEKRRIIAVGTTTVRTLEDSSTENGVLRKSANNTNIFIYPPYRFKFVDAMITNFHLPKSTLIMLVSAFAGKDFVLEAYKHAVKDEYRFYSFGDAMFIA